MSAAVVAVVLLAVGTVTHVDDFLLAGRRLGIDLAMAIMVTDLTANAYAATFIRHANPLAETGVLRLAVPHASRALNPRESRSQPHRVAVSCTQPKPRSARNRGSVCLNAGLAG